jgi:hypothetical protein
MLYAELKPLQPQQPEKCSSDAIKSWKFKTEGCSEQDPRLRKMWSEPTWAGFQLRSKTYLQSKMKETSAPPRTCASRHGSTLFRH